MFAKSAFNSEYTRPCLAVAKKPDGNQEKATQPLVLDQARSFKQMHWRCGTVFMLKPCSRRSACHSGMIKARAPTRIVVVRSCSIRWRVSRGSSSGTRQRS